MHFPFIFALVFGLVFGGFTWAQNPPGFIGTDVAPPVGDDWNEAVGITFQDNGRGWVWERGGRVWVVGETTPSLDISEEVGAWHDQGFLGFALHPNFDQNGYLYLLYLVDRHHLLHCREPDRGNPDEDNIFAPICDSGYDPAIDETFAASMGRLARYQAVLPSGSIDYSDATQVDPNSRTILIGRTISTGIPSTSSSHVTGSLVFGTDKTLLVSTGDGSLSARDFGSASTALETNSYTLQALNDTILHPDQDVGANRSQMLTSLNGKILRIDAMTGDGISSNPYFDAMNPDSVQSKVWASGFRNPFRTSLKPDTGSHDPADADPGVLFVGDVGRIFWEEINVVDAPGQNFGWPLYEGMDFLDVNAFNRGEIDNRSAPNPRFGVAGCTEEFFQFSDLIVQDTLNTPDFPNPCGGGQQVDAATPTHIHTRPILTWLHNPDETRAKSYDGSGNAISFRISDPLSPIQGTEFRGSAVTGGVFYTGSEFPAEYQGSYFFADFTRMWTRRLVFDANDNPVAVEEFGNDVGGVVSIASNPVTDGLHYISWTTDIVRLNYAPGGNFAPEAIISADTLFGPSPLSINFDATNSTDPELQALTYSWNFGDGMTSTLAMPQHDFPVGSTAASYTVTLTVDDGLATNSTSVEVSRNNSPPNVNITSPVDGTSYPINADTTYDLIADISDMEQSQNQLSCEWIVALHHNTHNHQNPPLLGCQQQAVLSDAGCDGDTYFYRVALTVTDPFGLVTSDSVDLPQGNCSGEPVDPVANNDFATVTTGGSVVIPILINDTDNVGLLPSSVQIESGPTGATITSIDAASGAVTLLHDGASAGPVTFTYSVEDLSNVRSNIATVSVNVSTGSSNTAPQIAIIPPVSVEESDALTIGLSATDPDGDGVSFSSSNLPGFAILNNFAGDTGEIQFAPGIGDIGQYTITVDVTDDASSPLGDSTDFIVTVTAMGGSARVGSGLVAFYPLTEGAGTSAADQSNNGAPMNLEMSGAVSWLGSGPGLSFNGGRLGTSGAASKVITALQSSGSSSFEIFALPANLSQTGPARLMSVGGDNNNQNFVLGQDDGDYQVRLQHTSKDAKSRPRLQVNNGVAVAVQHIVHSFDGGVERFYIDGVEQPAMVALNGNYNGWDSSDLFNVGNEASNQRPFIGEIYLVAVYDRALSPVEIQQNFAAGLGGTVPANQPPMASAGTDRTAVLPNTLTLAGVVTDDGLPNPPGATSSSWSQIAGTGTATFTDNTSLTSGVSFDADGIYTLRLTANDGEWIATDDVVVTVEPIAPVSVPDVVGLSQTLAESDIVTAGLVVGAISTVNSSSVPAGDVIDQSPLAGTQALPGSTVTLTVSLGPVPTLVPNVIGDSESTATITINAAGFIVGSVTTASHPTVPLGLVLNQSPLGDSAATPGSVVNLTISSGPNVAPAATDDNYDVATNSALTVLAPGLLGNDFDADGDSISAIVVSSTANGILSLGTDGSLSYTPDTGFTGADTFVYKVNDGQSDSNETTVTFDVQNPAADVPVPTLVGQNFASIVSGGNESWRNPEVSETRLLFTLKRLRATRMRSLI